MSKISDTIAEAKSGLDKFVPPPAVPHSDLGKHCYHQSSVTIPDVFVKLERYDIPWTFFDGLATVAMFAGIAMIGFFLTIILH